MKRRAQNKVIIVFVAVATIVALAGLTGVFTGTPSPRTAQEDSSGDDTGQQAVPCLVSEQFHLHPHVTVLVDGEGEDVPGNIGVLPGCVRELHTHETDGIIHVESHIDKGYTLVDFFGVWGADIARPGYILSVTVDGEHASSLSFRLEDGQEIILNYITPPFDAENPPEAM